MKPVVPLHLFSVYLKECNCCYNTGSSLTFDWVYFADLQEYIPSSSFLFIFAGHSTLYLYYYSKNILLSLNKRYFII